MPLVIGGPEVEFCQDSVYLKSLYLPVLGRCFSNRPSSFRTTPPVTVLVVVFCVPMPISSVVCALDLNGHQRDGGRGEQWKETRDFRSRADAHENNPFELNHVGM